MNRRGFLGSILLLGAAPAIVRADSLMRIVPIHTSILRGPSLAGEMNTAWMAWMQVGDRIRYSPCHNVPEWFNDKSLPAEAKRDIDRRLDAMAVETGAPVIDREYLWLPGDHCDKSDPLGQYAVVAAKGKTIAR